MSDRKKLIFLSILALWLFWGESFIFMYPNVEVGLVVFIFVTCGLGMILTLSNNVDGNFFKLFSYFKAKEKGKKCYGYIYQIVEDNTNDPNAANTIGKTLDLHEIDTDDPKQFLEVLRKLSGTLVLRIAMYDNIEKQVVLIEQKVKVGRLMEFIRTSNKSPYNQYIYIYKYKGKNYTALDDVIPKFVVPKSERAELQNKVKEMNVYEVNS